VRDIFGYFFSTLNSTLGVDVRITKIVITSFNHSALNMEFLLNILRSLLTSPLLLIASIFGSLTFYVSTVTKKRGPSADPV
jgi:hypothetical protein